jgi:hypothetical protein
MAYRFFRVPIRALAVTLLASAVALGASATAIVAQDADSGTAPRSAPAGPNAGVAPPPPSATTPETRPNPPFDPIAARIRYLHARLRITPVQEPLWAKVAEVMRESEKAVAPLIRQRLQTAEHGTALDALGSYEKLGEGQLEELKKFITAFDALYAKLSPAQKKIADTLFRIGPLAMIGGIPGPPEALIAPPPSSGVPAYPAYAALPPPYPGYGYYPYYSAYAYPYYPFFLDGRPWLYGRPWPRRPPVAFGIHPFFFPGPHHFEGFAAHRH